MCVGFFSRHFFNVSLNAHLPTLWLPVEGERGVRIAPQLAPLATPGVGEEHEAALVDFLEQDEPDGGLPAMRGGRKRDRLIVRNFQTPRLMEPADEFRDRVGGAPRHRPDHELRFASPRMFR